MRELDNINCVILNEDDLMFGWKKEIENGDLKYEDLKTDYFTLIARSSIERAHLVIFSDNGFDKILKLRD